MFNASHIPIDYKLPPENYGTNWKLTLDTSKDLLKENVDNSQVKDTIKVEGRSVVVLQHSHSKPKNQEDGNAD